MDREEVQRAIDILSDPMGEIVILENNGGIDFADDGLIKACNLAITALRKQIPMKRIYSDGGADCPTCGATPDDYDDRYCSYCGQAIDLS